jgi:hypothetical protein
VIGGTGLELYNLVAEYELTGDAYTETRLYDVTSGSTGSPTYQLTGQPVRSAVTVDSGTVTFDEPSDGSELAFTPTGLTATLELRRRLRRAQDGGRGRSGRGRPGSPRRELGVDLGPPRIRNAVSR